MSELKTNKISTNDQNNVAIDNALGLKGYTTAQRDALSSPTAGDTIYNSETGTIDYYNGTAWFSSSDNTFAFGISYLLVAGGGAAGGAYGAGGGAGGMKEDLTGSKQVLKNTSLTVTVGAGGPSENTSGNNGQFADVTVTGGGTQQANGGSGGGARGYFSNTPGQGTNGEGNDGGNGSVGYKSSGGGGGKGAAGADATSVLPGFGGIGGTTTIITTSQASTHSVGEIDGANLYFAGGGSGGGNLDNNTTRAGGKGGGGRGYVYRFESAGALNGGNGTVNTGGGGVGGNQTGTGGTGGSGVVILKWATSDATIGSTRTGLTDTGVQTSGTDSYIVFTQGTGTISFS